MDVCQLKVDSCRSSICNNKQPQLLHFRILCFIILLTASAQCEVSVNIQGDATLSFLYSKFESQKARENVNLLINDPAKRYTEIGSGLNFYTGATIEGQKASLVVSGELFNNFIANTGKFDFLVYEALINVYPCDWFSLKLGKQLIDWGSGYFFNPSNPLNITKTDPSQYNRRREGTPGCQIGLKFPNGNFSSTSFVLMPTAGTDMFFNWDTTSFNNAIPKQTIAGEVLYFALWKTDFNVGAVYEYHKIFRPFIAISTDFLGTVWSVETAVEYYNQRTYLDDNWNSRQYKRGDDFPLVDFALQKTFAKQDFSLSVVLEGFYSKQGYTESQAKKVLSYFDLLKNANFSELSSMQAGFVSDNNPIGRKYSALSIIASYLPYIQNTMELLVNIDDKSYLVHNEINWNSLDYLNLGVDFLYKGGPKVSEFKSDINRYRAGIITKYFF